MNALERLGLALAGVSWLNNPPDWWGNPGLGIAALSGTPRPVPWDVFASATAPGIPGDTVHFAVDEEGTIVPRDPGVPVEALDPLADAVTEQLGPPFVALAALDEDDVWAVVANEAEVIDLADAIGETIEISSVGGVVTCRFDGAEADLHLPKLRELLDWQGGDCSLVAHRFVGDTFVVELFPL